jgi:hypothetical protein
MHGRNDLRLPTETARHTAHLAGLQALFFSFFFFLLWLPTPASRSATEDRWSRTHHHAIGMLGPRHEWKTARGGQEIRAHVFPQQPANRKAPCPLPRPGGPGTVTWSSELNEYYSCAVQGPAARTPACDYQPASQSPPLLRSTPWSRFRFRRQQKQSCRDVRGAKIKKACLTMVSGNQPRFRSNSKQQGCGLCGSAKPTCPVPLHCLVRSARQSSRHTTSHWLSRVTAHYQYSALGRGEPTRPGHEG